MQSEKYCICMEGKNFPNLLGQNLFPFSDAFNNDLSSDVLGQSTQNPEFVSSNQVDLGSLLSCAAAVEQIPSSSSNIMEEVENVCRNKEKFGKKNKYNPRRVAFHTRSAEDVLDDGYKWRKYGQKSVKNSDHPRSYYRCTHHTCHVKKQIQRLSNDISVVVTTYEGIHNHPCEKLMETLSPLLNQLQFLARF